MWWPLKIEINNLFATEHLEYEFANNVCTIVTGKNLTDKNLENNGAGKSTIFEAIALALTGDSLRAIKKDSFINDSDDVKSCRILMELVNDVNKQDRSSIHLLKIDREFYKSSKSSVVRIFENGVQNTQLVSVAEANKRVFELLGVCKDDLLRYFIISQDNRYNFFTASDSDKKDILNRITNANMIDDIISSLSDRVKSKQYDLEAVKVDESKLLGKIELIDSQIKDLLENDDTDYEVRRLESAIEQLKKDIADRIEKKDDLKVQLVDLKSRFKNMQLVDLSKLKERLNSLHKKMDDVDDELLEYNKINKKLELILDGVLECPKCGERFVLENDFKLTYEEAKEIKNKCEKNIESKKAIIIKLQDKINVLQSEIRKAKESNAKYEDMESRLRKQGKLIEVEEYEIESLELQIDKKNNAIKDLKSGVEKRRRIAELKNEKKKIEKSYEKTCSVIKVADDELNMLKFWQFNMGRSGFQTYLANKSIKLLEGTINNFLVKMKIDYRVQIEPYKILKSGDVREKIDCFVSADGVNWKNFLSFSGGERQRIILAGILSIQKLINDSLGAGGLNMLLLDESLGNIDTCGTMDIVNILERIGVTTMLITQNIEEPEKIFENCLSVVKVNGVSKFQS